MLFGSVIAGSMPLGGGVVAFPVVVLFIHFQAEELLGGYPPVLGIAFSPFIGGLSLQILRKGCPFLPVATGLGEGWVCACFQGTLFAGVLFSIICFPGAWVKRLR